MNRILIVDDNDVNRLLASMTLEREGRLIDEARDGIEALELLARNDYDCVLLDISMPRMSGYEVCARIRQAPRTAGLRVIAYTAHALDTEHRKILSSGFDGVLTKPVDVGVFERMLGEPASAG